MTFTSLNDIAKFMRVMSARKNFIETADPKYLIYISNTAIRKQAAEFLKTYKGGVKPQSKPEPVVSKVTEPEVKVEPKVEPTPEPATEPVVEQPVEQTPEVTPESEPIEEVSVAKTSRKKQTKSPIEMGE